MTLASVMLFAKFITHRTRSHFDVEADQWHRACVYSCVGALLLAFAGIARTDPCWLSWLLAGLSAAATAFGGWILLRDVLVDDRGRVAESSRYDVNEIPVAGESSLQRGTGEKPHVRKRVLGKPNPSDAGL